jgi:subtilisin family serine protease
VTTRSPAPAALAVLDVGFHRHPDLAARRVLACIDATGRRAVPFRYGAPGTGAEHGTRTMLLAAGSGRASGLVSPAPRSPVVLVKVGEGGRVPRAAIVRAFRWLVSHAERFGIRVVLCPLGDDAERRGDKSEVPALVATLAARRVVVVAAAGWDPANEVVSPARSPHAIGVGGWDVADDRPARGPRVGVVEGFLKPDFLAPAVPLDVPCLLGTQRHERAGGTSFAAALVAGAALRVLEAEPGLGKDGVLSRLAALARPVPGLPPYLPLRTLRRPGPR